MKTGYNQQVFESIMSPLDKKEKLLLEYLKITNDVTKDSLIEILSDVLNRRNGIINEVSECDLEVMQVAKKLFGNESQAVIGIIKYKTPEDINLPPFLQPIDNKCKIIYNILCSIKEADAKLSTKVQFAREDVLTQISQVKNNKQVFGYTKNFQSANLGNIIDQKR